MDGQWPNHLQSFNTGPREKTTITRVIKSANIRDEKKEGKIKTDFFCSILVSKMTVPESCLTEVPD